MTYLVSIFAFAIKLVVFTHLSSKFVHVGRRWCKIIVQIEWFKACSHGLTKRCHSGLLARRCFWFEIGSRVESWSGMVQLHHWCFWFNFGWAWEVLRLQAIHRHGYTAGVEVRLLVFISVQLAFLLVLRSSGHGERSSSWRVSGPSINLFITLGIDHLIQCHAIIALWLMIFLIISRDCWSRDQNMAFGLECRIINRTDVLKVGRRRSVVSFFNLSRPFWVLWSQQAFLLWRRNIALAIGVGGCVSII